MAKGHKPRYGSLAYVPRKRSKKQTPRVHSWQDSGEPKLLGFAGYKAGMTHVLALDGRKNSPSSGLEKNISVTVLDAPPMFIAGIRAYVTGYGGKETAEDAWASEIPKDLAKKITIPKGKDSEKKLDKLAGREDISDIVVIACTQPQQTSLSKKKPDIMEIAIGGTIPEKIEYAKQILGKEVSAKDVLAENSFTDVCAVTKGKGFQGPVKRWGISIQPRKATKGRRHGGTGGAWTPTRKLWCEPQAGQMGYHTRTEYNKLILSIGKDGATVTPAGGFLNYGTVKGEHIIIAGSVPGPAKRIIRVNAPKRARSHEGFEITYISITSKQGV
ncbi:MAG: 50S ribosomal protein L3 [Candidatus Altiarchaeota archaeon]